MSLDDDDRAELPPGLDLLWGRRQRGRKGPQPGLSLEAVVETAMAVADAEGLDAVSMARVADELGYSTMALYRYVDNKEELLQLMWNSSAVGAPEITGASWRERLEAWALAQRGGLSRRLWLLRMPLAVPPAGPSSMAWVEQAMAALEGTGLSDAEKLGVISTVSSLSLSDARMELDWRTAVDAGKQPIDFGALLRLVADPGRFPHLHRAAHSGDLAESESDPLATFRFGLYLILDGVQALIDRRAKPSRHGR
jgi:AcrR family transcriptional regulator